MKAARRRRLLQVLGLALLGGLFVALVVSALVDDTGAYLSPSQLAEQPRPAGARLSVGGWVRKGSWQQSQLDHSFTLIDAGAELQVQYRGILPDLFAEGEAAVASGRLLAGGVLAADEVLARHDENYRPPGVEPPPASERATSGSAPY